MRICVTRDMAKVRERVAEIRADHPEWKYGIFVSNFAEQKVIQKALPGWNIHFNGANTVSNGGYGPWFAGDCMSLTRARKEMILLIPADCILDETYQYFVDMGMDVL